MRVDDWNRAAVLALMTDADRTLALTVFDDTSSDRAAAQNTIDDIRKSYLDLIRRSGPLVMSDGELIAFQTKMDRMRACLRFFGATF
jgi:hypothetical protein